MNLLPSRLLPDIFQHDRQEHESVLDEQLGFDFIIIAKYAGEHTQDHDQDHLMKFISHYSQLSPSFITDKQAFDLIFKITDASHFTFIIQRLH